MDFGDKLKEIRRREGLSQEQLAERIGVSRQAITKWETKKGLPDLENMMILAEIFKTTLDELVYQGAGTEKEERKEFCSETIYDIDNKTHFDIHFGSAKEIEVVPSLDEKLHVVLKSKTLENLEQLFKIKLDEKRKKIDVNCFKKGELSEKEIREELSVTIMLPKDYTNHCELEASAKEVSFVGLHLDCFEYDGEASFVTMKQCRGSFEFTGKTDFDITVDEINGRLQVYQLWANSIIHVTKPANFHVNNSGRKSRVYWNKNEQTVESFENVESENELCIAGIKSEMIVSCEWEL